MPTPREVCTLVQRFHENRASYVSGPYNETQTRIEFVDPADAKTAHEKTMIQRPITLVGIQRRNGPCALGPTSTGSSGTSRDGIWTE